MQDESTGMDGPKVQHDRDGAGDGSDEPAHRERPEIELEESCRRILAAFGFDEAHLASLGSLVVLSVDEARQRAADSKSGVYCGDAAQQTFAEREFIKLFAEHARQSQVLAALHSDMISSDERRQLALMVETWMKRSTNPVNWYTPRAWPIHVEPNAPQAVSDFILGLVVTFIAAQEKPIVAAGMSLLEAARRFGAPLPGARAS